MQKTAHNLSVSNLAQNHSLSDEDLAKQSRELAFLIIKAFDKSFRKFSQITAGAQNRFENCDWQASQSAIKERIDIYEQFLVEAVANIYQLMHPHQQNREFWQAAKANYSKLLGNHAQLDLAETFYNSVLGRVFKHSTIDNDLMFVLSQQCYFSGHERPKVVNVFKLNNKATDSIDLFTRIFQHYQFNVPFSQLGLDIKQLSNELNKRLGKTVLNEIEAAELIKPVFYRGKAAYLVGRLCLTNRNIPFVIALQIKDDRTIFVDALLTQAAHVSVIFSFARSYFMLNTQFPAAIVAFLQELLPHKKDFELYMSLGFYKHGKTVFYRDYLKHLDQSGDHFGLAPGIKGLVMAVFHLPSYGVVFKVIKDEFAESKKITREHVKKCYQLVKTSDRVGRMADTHEYVNFRFPKQRFDKELLEYLQDTCANSIEQTDTEIIIKHLYIERKMTPLNLYFQTETDEQKVEAAINELGNCIKQIAFANIFPGDMLHKNFGITKTGRVIFYDYDEICFMNERIFRDLPQSDDPYALDTLSVGPLDVFPAQFEHFIVGKKHLKDLLKSLHPELMQPQFWRDTQQTAAKGIMQDFTPYPETVRFNRP
jgi:isocitrate dehydrogenase kinase/phosphatase